MTPKTNITEKIAERLVTNGQIPAHCKDQFAQNLQGDIVRAVDRYRLGLASQVVHKMMLARLAA